MRWFQFILADWKNNPTFFWLFVFNITLGLVGFLALEIIKDSITTSVFSQSKNILGADLGISARRPITEQEKEINNQFLPKTAKKSEMIEVYSMVANEKGDTRLVQLKAIEEDYPFYGNILLENQPTNLPNPKLENSIWIYPEILLQLKVELGDFLKIGEKRFKIVGIIKQDSSAGITNQMAPKVYLSLSDLKQTGLITSGSIAWHSVLYYVPFLNQEQLEELRLQLFDAHTNHDLRIFTHVTSSERSGNLLKYVNDFLGLISIVALFLASIGSGFLFRSFLQKRKKQIAILRCLGITPNEASTLYFIQLILLALISCILSVGVSMLVFPILGNVFSNLLPSTLQLTIGFSPFLRVFIIGICIVTFTSLPILLGLRNISPAQILLGENQQDLFKINLFYFIPLFISFWGLSIWQSNSLITGSLFTFLFSLALLGFMFLGYLNFNFLFPKIKSDILPLKWAIRDLSRLRLSGISVFVCLGLGLILLYLIPQIESSLQKEILPSQENEIPSLFFFDIQEDQVTDLKSILQKQRIELIQLSPIIRGKIQSINGKAFEKGEAESSFSREKNRENRFRNRGVNLSYRNQLTESETILEGRDFSGTYDFEKNPIAEVSIEKRYAKRLGIKYDDEIVFVIEGIPISTKVVNIRSVRWTSFRPNFFIQLQSGVLEDAPKTFLAVAFVEEMKAKNYLQNEIVQQLPNISIIDVTRLIERIQNIVNHVSWALSIMATLCLLAGFMVLYSISNYQLQERKYDIGLLKIIGAKFREIRFSFYLQYFILSVLAMLFAILISMGVSSFLSFYLFDISWNFPVFNILILSILILTFSFFVIFFAVEKNLSTPSSLLIKD